MREIELTEAKKRELKKNPHGPFTPRNIKDWKYLHTSRARYEYWDAATIRDETVAAMILDMPVTRVWVTESGELNLDIYPRNKKEDWRKRRQPSEIKQCSRNKSGHCNYNTGKGN